MLALAFVAYLVVVRGAAGMSRRALGVGIAAAIALFALSGPLLSLDLFSYASYGRLEVEGLNPYEAAPADLPDDPAAQRVRDYREAPSVYGPLFTALSALPAMVGPEFALWALKGLSALAALALALLAGRVALARGGSWQRATALVGLNPILLVHGVGGGHNDVLVALGGLAAGALAWGSREALAGAALSASVAVKTVGGLVAPFALLGVGGGVGRAPGAARARLLAGALGAGALIAAGALALYGTAAAEALNILGSSQERISTWGVPNTIARIGIDVDVVRVVLAITFGIAVLWLLRWTWQGADWVRAAGWATVALLVASAYLTPWYVLWALPLAAVARDRALTIAVLVLTAFQLRPTIPL